MPKHLAKILKNKIDQAIREKLFPGCVIGIITEAKKRLIICGGNFRYENKIANFKDQTASLLEETTEQFSNPEINETSIFDVASITKVIPTSFLALLLIDQKKLKLSHRLIDFLPEFQGKYGEKMILFHLLTQTCDFDIRLSECKKRTPEELLKSIFSSSLKSPSGSKINYCNTTSILLGLILEKATGKNLDLLADKLIFKKLEMKNSTFHPKIFAKNQIVPTEIDPWRQREIQGEIHDESAFILKPKITPGSAGLFSTAPDLLNFLEMLLNKGNFHGQQIISAEMLSQIDKNSELKTGLGFERDQPWMGAKRTPHTIGKTGFTGCSILADIPRKIGLVILSNHTWPSRRLSKKGHADKKPINQFRAAIADLILQK